MRDAIISALIHDLRSPIGAIGIFCELQASGKQSNEDSQSQNSKMIKLAAAKAQLALEDAAEIAGICRGTMQADKLEPADLGALLENVCSDARDLCARKGIVLGAARGHADSTLKCQPVRTREILTCMLQEAICASPKHGEIGLSVGVGPSGVSVTVRSDTRAPDHTANSRCPDPYSLKGRLGERKPGVSRYSLAVCAKLASYMGGSFSWVHEPAFSAILHLPFAHH